jgi:hypothetical protein
MIYELWELQTANIVGSFDTEREALDAVQKAVSHHDRSIARTWALFSKDLATGAATELARGASLIRRANELLPA